MKKIVSLLLVIISVIIFSSCSGNEIDKVSKDLSTYTIEAVFDEQNMEIYANQNLQYINNEELPLSELCFHLYPNAYREGASISPINQQSITKAYPNGISYGSIDIIKAELKGEQCSFTIGGEDMNILTIALKEQLYPGDKITVDLEYNINLPNTLHRFGYNVNTVNLGNWYPVLCVYENGSYQTTPYYSNGDPFYTDCANYIVNITMPDTYKGAFTGNIINVSSQEGTSTYQCQAKVVRDFAAVLSKNFQVLTAEVEDVAISYYYYDDEESAASLEIAKESILTYNSLFGKYPYTTLSVVETGFMHGGMEYPTLVYISDAIIGDSYKETIVHEIAHQWWYAVIGSDQVNNAWLDEGLTEYSTVLFYENNPKYNISREQMIIATQNSYKLFVDIFQQISGTADTSMNRAVNKYNSESEYVYMTYVKGELMFDAVRTSIGKEKFYKGLKRYYEDNKYMNASPASLITALERGSETKLEGFMNSWIEGNVII